MKKMRGIPDFMAVGFDLHALPVMVNDGRIVMFSDRIESIDEYEERPPAMIFEVHPDAMNKAFVGMQQLLDTGVNVTKIRLNALAPDVPSCYSGRLKYGEIELCDFGLPRFVTTNDFSGTEFSASISEVAPVLIADGKAWLPVLHQSTGAQVVPTVEGAIGFDIQHCKTGEQCYDALQQAFTNSAFDDLLKQSIDVSEFPEMLVRAIEIVGMQCAQPVPNPSV